MAFTVYLLHALLPNGTIEHYVGITRRPKLEDRLNEHARAHGAITTAAWVRAGSRLFLAASHHVSRWTAERDYLLWYSDGWRCPICSGLTAAPPSAEITCRVPAQPKASEWQPLQPPRSPTA